MATALTEISQRFEAEGLPEFKPGYFYEPHMDTLQYFVKDEQSHENRLNDRFTIFVADDDKSLVGFEIKGVTEMMDNCGAVIWAVTAKAVRRLPMSKLVEWAIASPPSPNVEPNGIIAVLVANHEEWSQTEVDREDLAQA